MEVFINLAIGLLVPIVVSFVKSAAWPDYLKLLLSLGIALIVGAATTWAAGQIDGSPWTLEAFLQNSGLIFTSATAFYKTAFQGTNFNRERLEPGGPFPATPTPADQLLPDLEPEITPAVYAGSVDRPKTIYLDPEGHETPAPRTGNARNARTYQNPPDGV